MSGAGAALQAAAAAALRTRALGGVYEGPPIQAAFPYAVVECGAEADWGHKSGRGRELRLAVSVRDAGERPARLHALMAEAEAAVAALSGLIEGWRLVTLTFLRSRESRDKAGWTGLIEFRARMLEEEN